MATKTETLFKAIQCLYIEVHPDIASDIKSKAADALDEKDAEIERLKAIIEKLFKSEYYMKLSADEKVVYWERFKTEKNL